MRLKEGTDGNLVLLSVLGVIAKQLSRVGEGLGGPFLAQLPVQLQLL